MTLDAATVPPGMGQCSVTGKIVPEDELVTINGQRVCAEGKAILLDRLRSGETLPGEWEKPSIIRRFLCSLLDGLVIVFPFSVLQGILTATLGEAAVATGVVALVGTVAQIIYFGAMYASRGQSVGKIAGKLRVVNDNDGSPVTTGTAYIRALAYLGPGILSDLGAITGNAPIIIGASVIVGVWGLTDVIFALADTSRQRALHDRIAGTRVVYEG